MSANEPNLLGLPKDPRIRRCFIASSGFLIVKADYSAIELRIAAEISGEPKLIEVFNNPDKRHGDPHYQMAAALTGKPIEVVTKEDRDSAKVANFGLLYGAELDEFRQSAADKYGVFLEPEQAEQMIRTFRTLYPVLYLWQKRQGKGSGDVFTLGGRRRRLVKKYNERLNTPVQGSGADGLKRALALLWQRRSEVPSLRFLLTVHDEIVLEAQTDEAEAARDLLERSMLEAMACYVKRVPIKVESAVGSHWAVEADHWRTQYSDGNIQSGSI